MYKSILASALITLSASNAFAYDWLNEAVNAGVADKAHIHFKQQEFNNIFNRQAAAHRRNGATGYNAHTYAAFNASEGIGYDGTGINVLVKDIHNGAGSHGYNVSHILSVFAPGVTIDEEPNIIESAAESHNAIVNESLGFDLVNEFDDGLAALNRHTWGNWTSQPIAQSELGTLDPLHRIATEYGHLGSDALFITAASNHFQDCLDLINCNSLVSKHVAFDEAVIAVGALNNEGTELDNYSNKAGLFQDFYISAPVAELDGSRGTSCAVPIVTAAAALVMDQFGTNAVQTRDILLDTADDLGAPGTDAVFGRGRLNVHRALSPIGALR